ARDRLAANADGAIEHLGGRLRGSGEAIPSASPPARRTPADRGSIPQKPPQRAHRERWTQPGTVVALFVHHWTQPTAWRAVYLPPEPLDAVLDSGAPRDRARLPQLGRAGDRHRGTAVRRS